MSQELEHSDLRILSRGLPPPCRPHPHLCGILVLGLKDMWLWGGGSLRHRQRRTIWSRKTAKELVSLDRELGNMGEGS